MDIKRLRELCDQRLSTYGIAAELGCSQTTVRYWVTKLSLSTNPRQVVEWPDAEFKEACATSVSIGEVIERMGASAYSGNYRRVKEQAARLGIPYPDGRKTGAAQSRRSGPPKRLDRDEILARFCRRETPTSNSLFKKWMIHRLEVPEMCSACGLGAEWNGRPLVLELDHIDGDRFNYEMGNLRLLCPNCHAQQPTTNRRKVAPAPL